MIKNYIKIAFRNILRQKGFSLINIAGLAIGMACSIIILMWVIDEVDYDKFHENANTLYRIEQDQFYSGESYHVNVTPYVVAPAFKEGIPEVIDATRFVYTGGLLFRQGEISFFESGTICVDSTFLDMFTFPLVEGDKNTALDEPYSIVLSKEIAKKYFGEESPIGKALNVNNQYEFIVKGVFEDIPQNSTLQFDMLMSFDFLHVTGRYHDHWGSNSIQSFLQIREGSDVEAVNQKLTDMLREHQTESQTIYMAAPYTRIHLFAYFGFGHDRGNIQFIYIFSIIALFILLIACINFMNLSTARSVIRAKEIGLRKVTGALRYQLITQFYGESLFLSFIAFVLALIIAMLLIGPFNQLAYKEFSPEYLFTWKILLGYIGITLFTGLFAGSYPALLLSGFKPVRIMKGATKSGAGGRVFRIILVVFQFTMSIFLIIGTGIVYKQTRFLKNKEIGFDKEHIVCIVMRGEIRNYYDVIKNELSQDTRIMGVTASSHRPSYIGSNSGGAEWEGKDPEKSVLIGTTVVDYDFIETMKIEMKSGRSFSREFPSDFVNDSVGTFLINEETERIMGVESALGMNLSFMGREGQIVGIMKDFHFQPAREGIEPLAMIINPASAYYMLIRITPGDIPSSIEFLESKWEEIVPDYPFDYFFLDEDFDSMYRVEDRIGILLRVFTIVAIVVACLGLFGLASFSAEQRTKEIGIRKVMGASISGIVILLSTNFSKWVIVAFVIAGPLAGFVLKKFWLQNYAYPVSLGWFIFVSTYLQGCLQSLGHN